MSIKYYRNFGDLMDILRNFLNPILYTLSIMQYQKKYLALL